MVVRRSFLHACAEEGWLRGRNELEPRWQIPFECRIRRQGALHSFVGDGREERLESSRKTNQIEAKARRRQH